MRTSCFFYKIQRSITQKLGNGEQSFLCETHCLDLTYTFLLNILKIVHGRAAPCHNTTIFFQNGIIPPFFFQNRHTIIHKLLSVILYKVMSIVLFSLTPPSLRYVTKVSTIPDQIGNFIAVLKQTRMSQTIDHN